MPQSSESLSTNSEFEHRYHGKKFAQLVRRLNIKKEINYAVPQETEGGMKF